MCIRDSFSPPYGIITRTVPQSHYPARPHMLICCWRADVYKRQVLGLYSFAGWYIGMQNSRFPMYIAITQNIVNIAVSLLLVYGLGMKKMCIRDRVIADNIASYK